MLPNNQPQLDTQHRVPHHARLHRTNWPLVLESHNMLLTPVPNRTLKPVRPGSERPPARPDTTTKYTRQTPPHRTTHSKHTDVHLDVSMIIESCSISASLEEPPAFHPGCRFASCSSKITCRDENLSSIHRTGSSRISKGNFDDDPRAAMDAGTYCRTAIHLGRSRKAHTSFQMAAATKGTGDA